MSPNFRNLPTNLFKHSENAPSVGVVIRTSRTLIHNDLIPFRLRTNGTDDQLGDPTPGESSANHRKVSAHTKRSLFNIRPLNPRGRLALVECRR